MNPFKTSHSTSERMEPICVHPYPIATLDSLVAEAIRDDSGCRMGEDGGVREEAPHHPFLHKLRLLHTQSQTLFMPLQRNQSR